MTIIKDMFNLQEELNNYIAGINWKKGFTKTGEEINWLRCLKFEMVEAIDQSFQWKHWKNNKINKQYDIINLHNLKIELIDGYHFLMSEIKRKETDTKEILSLKFNDITPYKLNNKELLLKIENYINMIFNYEIDIKKLYIEFWKISLSVMSLNEFYNIYILKNVLNLFRLRHGYQDNTYIKNWGKDKIEDNVFLDNYLKTKKENELIVFQDIYDYLEVNYINLNKIKK